MICFFHFRDGATKLKLEGGRGGGLETMLKDKVGPTMVGSDGQEIF